MLIPAVTKYGTYIITIYSCNYTHMSILSSRWLYVHSVPAKPAVPVGPCMYICLHVT